MQITPAYPDMPAGTRVRYSEHGPCRAMLGGKFGTVTGICPRAGWILVRFDGSGENETKCGVLALDVVLP